MGSNGNRKGWHAMGVYLLKRKDGSYDPRWHGRWMVDGQRKHATLNLWQGTPPGPGEEVGDAAFERSRGKAEETFKRVMEGDKSKAEETVLTQKILRARYGTKVKAVKLTELASRWDELPRGTVTEERIKRVHSVLSRFVTFMGEHFPGVKEAGGLLPKHFKDFLADVEKTGCTPRTWNDVLDILRMVLRRVDGQSKGFQEYLADLPKKTKEQRAQTVHRQPFTAAELYAIFKAAEEIDPELRPLIVTAACTALRRGDVARLRWDDIDLKTGGAKVATSKTGEPVYLPIDRFPPLKTVLEEAARNRRGEEPFVFPKIARQYAVDPKWLNRHLEKVLKAAGITATRRELREGVDRKNRASIGLWHAFRATFVTLALSCGVPVQTILSITGHTNEKTLYSFYDRRTVETWREEMGKAFAKMPKAISGAVNAEASADQGAKAEDGEGVVYVAIPQDRVELAERLASADAKTLAALARVVKKGGEK